ncbi:MAG: radical SAM family heme chaperone HemW [Mangrovibacterium sp.]
MAGIYIHIPFCKTRCYYCDFYKTTNLGMRGDFLTALGKEISQRQTELGMETVKSLYLGGGTPSVLSGSELEGILNKVFAQYSFCSEPEITLEANPDDLSLPVLKGLLRFGVNRLSLGVQSFDDRDLKTMNRRHSAQQAVKSILLAREAGFSNLSIDLIYGLPEQTLSAWERNLHAAVELPVSHISAYDLSFHEGTVFYKHLKSGKLSKISDELSLAQFKLLRKKLGEAGFEAYEISNFARDGRYSIHNRSYWERKPYLGFGPSAHSYDLETRRWNYPDLKKYLEAIKKGLVYWNYELLRPQDQYNDYLITSLRTKWGINISFLERNFDSRFVRYFYREAGIFTDTGHLIRKDDSFVLSEEGLFISDIIIEKLFFTDRR